MMLLRLFFLFLIPIVSGLLIDCGLRRESDWPVIGDVHNCFLKSHLRITSAGTFVTRAKENRKLTMNHQSVTAFYALHKTLHFMPRGLSRIFPNLIAIRINYGYMKEIHQEDFKDLTKLQFLDLDQNVIKTLEADLFKFNLELKSVSFYNNKINQVHSTAFDNLNQLERLDMRYNECEKGIAATKSEVLELIDQIEDQCGTEENFETQTIKNNQNIAVILRP